MDRFSSPEPTQLNDAIIIEEPVVSGNVFYNFEPMNICVKNLGPLDFWLKNQNDGHCLTSHLNPLVKKRFASTGAESDIFIWGGHWRGQFCNKGSCQRSV